MTDDPVLTRFRAAAGDTCGDRLERVVIYGSRPRGDHRPDSDYDIAVFIHEPGDLWDELGVLSRITTDILMETDADISAKPAPDFVIHDASESLKRSVTSRVKRCLDRWACPHGCVRSSTSPRSVGARAGSPAA
ncbi:MAG: nucleotidyltransferase domain-containing protein [Alphaproteobacteria bacterium]